MTRFRSAAAAPLLGVLAFAAALSGGCDSMDIGDGTGPGGISISYNGLVDAYQTYECAAFNLSATAHFVGSNESDGDVTSRVRWTSSNPGIIDVSNGEIEAEPGSGTYFPAGTVIARAPGTAVIRADYVGLSDAFSVTADAIASLAITPELTRLAPGSKQQFALEVRFEDGDPVQDLTSSAIWTLPTAGAPAQLSAGALLETVTDPLDRPFVLEAQLFTCDRRAERELSLDALRELRLSYEQPQALPVPLGYTDEVRVEALFEDESAAPQNLSAQVEIEQILGDADYAAIAVGEYLTVDGYLADAPARFAIRYAPLDLEVATRSYVFDDVELQSLRLSPERGELHYPETLALQAYGLFSDGYERPVRRDIAWSNLNEDLISLVDSGTDAGEVTPLGLEGDATVEVRASNTEGAVTAEADISVYAE